ncbi:hypothetical protein ACQPZQ_22810 [Pseudonocardia sp. CA-142604]|uniref:hypothetical protein n=1 Tax=Pseudonocardia sp. CA-142604 TaxID=3240024 RepID=UPI003D9221C8
MGWSPSSRPGWAERNAAGSTTPISSGTLLRTIGDVSGAPPRRSAGARGVYVHRHDLPAQNVQKALDRGTHPRSRRPRSAGDVGILMALQRRAGNSAVVRAVQAARAAAAHAEHAVASPRGRQPAVHDVRRATGRSLDAGVRGDSEDRPGTAVGPPPASRPGHDPLETAPDHLVVQRKVGFEFETPWRAKRISTGEALGKRELIGTRFEGFKAEADADPEGGHSEIEFIVDPPVEEGDAGERRLTTVMRGLTRLGDQMERASITAGARPVDDGESPRPTPEIQVPFFRQHKATGRLADEDFAIIPRGNLRAAAQITSGFKLGAIPRLGDRLRPRPGDVRNAGDMSNVGDMGDMSDLAHMVDAIDYGDGGAHADARAFELPPAMARGAATLRSRAAQVQGRPALPNPSDDLKGLVGVISSYLVQGAASVPLAYPKQLGNLLLARTDFAKLFRLLPQNEQSLLGADPQLWVDLVVEAGSRGNAALYRGRIDPNQSVIKSGTERTGAVDLTVGRWLRAIPANTDLLTTIEGRQSMGAMGDTVEDVGPSAAREQAGIFEFRASQGVPLPLAEWFDFALGAQRYISRLHGG